MNFKTILILLAAVLANQSSGSVPFPYHPTGPNTPLAMAQAHEARVARGAGIMSPSLEIQHVKTEQGVIVLNENHGFPTGFLEGLAAVDCEGVNTYPVSVFLDDEGTFIFQNANDEIFWWIEPAFPGNYSVST